jgi:SAM-dependent methyltransferase
MALTSDAAALRGGLAGRIMGFMLSQAVYVATKLEIPDLVAAGPRSAPELAAAAGADPDALYRLLRMLAGHGIFVEHEDGSFTNSELSELLRDAPDSLRDFALVFGEDFYPALGETLHAVTTGEPAFQAVFGSSYDDYLAAKPEASTRFNRFMAGDKRTVAEVLAAEDWRGDELVVDVGGGNGALLQGLLERQPRLRGIVFDLPHVAPEAEERLRVAGLADRCEVVSGSFFEGVPAGGDVYILSHILHGLDDDRAAEVLRRVRQAILEDGRLLVVDGVVAPPNEPEVKLLDLLMLILGGRERTEAEWPVLLAAGGFALTGMQSGGWSQILEAAPV